MPDTDTETCTNDWHCKVTETHRHRDTCPWLDDWLVSEDDLPTLSAPSTQGKWTFTRMCSHEQDLYRLTDGTAIYLSASSDRTKARKEPDFAVYFSAAWVPTVPAYHLGWEDYGLPYLTLPNVLLIAREVLARSRAGQMVEIGCMGAHGRTGTFLAILELLTQENPDTDRAIDRVRLEHCDRAIESREQEWYIDVVAHHLRGEPLPKPLPKPKPAPKPAVKPAPKKDAPKPRGKRGLA